MNENDFKCPICRNREKKEIQKRNKTDSYQRLYYCVLDIAISQQQYSLINKAQLY